MKGTEFLEKLELIDPAYIEAAEQIVKEESAIHQRQRNRRVNPVSRFHFRLFVSAAAACLFLWFLFTIPNHLPQKRNNTLKDNPLEQEPHLEQNPQTESDPTESNTQIPPASDTAEDNTKNDGCPPLWDFHYNEITLVADTTRENIPGYFTQILHESDRMLVEPGKQIGWMDFSAVGGFDGEGKLLKVFLSTASTVPDTTISISISKNPFSCGLYSEEETISSCNGVEFLLYRYQTQGEPATVSLYAKAKINGLFYWFEMKADFREIEQAQSDFEDTLECFSFFKTEVSDFASISPDEIPEWFDRTLTYQEALQEADFGAYFLPSLPEGYQEESIRRHKDQHSDTLSGLWTKGYHSLSWQVQPYRQEYAGRETSVADTQNYDLSLYPIPRADSVPRDLWEIVDNPIFDAKELTLETVYARSYQIDDAGDSEGWRMEFSVRYGDILVQIHAKGLTPEWIYSQLEQLLDSPSE